MKPVTPNSVSLGKEVDHEKKAAQNVSFPIVAIASLAGGPGAPMAFDRVRSLGPGNQLEEIPERRHPPENALQLRQGLEQQVRVSRTQSSIIDYAYTFDRAGRFLYANQALLDLLGLTLDDLVGKNSMNCRIRTTSPFGSSSRLSRSLPHRGNSSTRLPTSVLLACSDITSTFSTPL